MQKIAPGYIITSAAYPVAAKDIRYYESTPRPPKVGDLVYGEICLTGQHSQLENRNGRIHAVDDGSRAIFVFGNRYAPDAFEGVIPDEPRETYDLLARSGVIGTVRSKNSDVKDPSMVRVLGHVCSSAGEAVNTRNYRLVEPNANRKSGPRSKLILVCGTSMNSGKTMSATACCWALRALGQNVRASKITGTASLKDILYMNDAGARIYNDFTFFGHPSTYLLSEEELLDIFNSIDLKYANNPKNYWVVEIADGILQRETAMLLRSPAVQSRIYRLIFCAASAFDCIGGLSVLRDSFDLRPHAISGVLSRSPLAIDELRLLSDIPVFNNRNRNLNQLAELLL